MRAGGSSWGRRVRRRLAAAWCCTIPALACAMPIIVSNGQFRNPSRGYRIDVPPEGWRRVEAEGADLAFVGPRQARMSLGSRCGAPLAEPRVLARHLVIGLPDRRVLAEAPVEVDGHPGWMRSYEVGLGDGSRYLKSVTVVADGCIYDWVLLVGREAQPVERTFDRWWSSVRLPGSEESPRVSGASP